MSLCDKCYQLGACCRGFSFITDDGSWLRGTEEQVNKWLEDKGLPMKYAGDCSEGTAYVYCPQLTSEGRCAIYDRRPAMCAEYEPASSQLCVHWRGAEGGEGVGELITD